MCISHISVCICAREVPRLHGLPLSSPHFHSLVYTAIKNGKHEIRSTFLILAHPIPIGSSERTGPITINIHFLGLAAKNRMFVVCCN